MLAEHTWRLDRIGTGRLAWLYLVPYAVDWQKASSAAEAAGYTITEESQSLVDDQLGGCLRYLAVQDRDPPGHRGHRTQRTFSPQTSDQFSPRRPALADASGTQRREILVTVR